MSTHMNITPIDRSVLAACAFGASEDQIIRMLVGPQPVPVPLELRMSAMKSIHSLFHAKLIVGGAPLYWLAGAAPEVRWVDWSADQSNARLAVEQMLQAGVLTGHELRTEAEAVSLSEKIRALFGKPDPASDHFVEPNKKGDAVHRVVASQVHEQSKPINESDFNRMVVQWGGDGASFEAHCVWPRQPGEDFQADRTMLRQSLMLAGFPTEIISVMDMQRPDAQPATEDDLADVDFSKQPEPVPAPDDGSEATEELADQFFPTPPDVAAFLVRPAPIDPSSLPKVLRESPLELVDVLDPDETALLDLAKNGRADETVPTPAMDADFEAFLNQPVRARQGLKPEMTLAPHAHDSLDGIQKIAQEPTQATGENTTLSGLRYPVIRRGGQIIGTVTSITVNNAIPEKPESVNCCSPAIRLTQSADAVKPAAKPATKSVREDTLDKLAPDIALLRDQGCDVDVDPPHPDKFFPTFSFRGPGERKTIQITHKDLKQRAARVRREMGA
jgi:hypothetical protein